jgi:hypothetical protein
LESNKTQAWDAPACDPVSVVQNSGKAFSSLSNAIARKGLVFACGFVGLFEVGDTSVDGKATPELFPK